ncbi:NU6M oxidoreductase, partial [Chloroceryle aenea]|nr:NU6M oxidoreductase [Chloroceryle aenea]
FCAILQLWFVLGGLAVASNPSADCGVGGIVLASVVGCGWLLSLGFSLALVSLMVYWGGMLVGFVYSVSLVADLF